MELLENRKLASKSEQVFKYIFYRICLRKTSSSLGIRMLAQDLQQSQSFWSRNLVGQKILGSNKPSGFTLIVIRIIWCRCKINVLRSPMGKNMMCITDWMHDILILTIYHCDSFARTNVFSFRYSRSNIPVHDEYQLSIHVHVY